MNLISHENGVSVQFAILLRYFILHVKVSMKFTPRKWTVSDEYVLRMIFPTKHGNFNIWKIKCYNCFDLPWIRHQSLQHLYQLCILGVPKVKKNFISEIYAQSSLVCGMTCSKFPNCIGFYYHDYLSSNETNCLLQNISTDFHMKNNAKDADKNTLSFYIMVNDKMI